MKIGNLKIENQFRFLIFLFVLLVVVLGLVYGGIRLYGKFFGPAELSLESILDEVGRLVVLPSDETPSMATVTDLLPLAGQEFFTKAQVGDKVLIFSKSSKAILYRPSDKLIVEIAPLAR
jgi:hypothetical protein